MALVGIDMEAKVEGIKLTSDMQNLIISIKRLIKVHDDLADNLLIYSTGIYDIEPDIVKDYESLLVKLQELVYMYTKAFLALNPFDSITSKILKRKI